jgi:hypothetical protein
VDGVSVSVAELGLSGITGADGVYDFGEVAPGTYTVSGQKDAYSPSAGNASSPASQSLPAPAGTSTQYQLKLDPGARMAVLVQQTDGTPVQGVTVSVDGKGWSGVTDASGNFDFGVVPPDTYTVTAQGNCPSPPPPSPISQTQPVPQGASTQFKLVLPPADFDLTAPCRILKPGGNSVQMSVSEKPGNPAGTYTWTSPSTNIRIDNPNSTTVTVSGLTVSSGRDAEVITIKRTCAGCADATKTVAVTVATVTFSASPNQRYGYDDYDTPADPTDDHICMKQSDYTFLKVDIQGGAVGTDFDFVCDDASICAPVAPGGDASFDLRINSGTTNKDATPLKAKSKCAGAEVFAQIQTHVYKEKFVEVVVAKIHDSMNSATDLNFPNADYAAETNNINAKMKEGVVKYSITNYDSANAQTDVRFDLDGNGVLSYDIAAGGGRELNAIKTAFTGTGTKTRVAIIKDMKSFYYLSAAASVGDTTITVTASSVFGYPGGSYPLGTGASQENVSVASSSGSTITLGSALTKAHAVGEPLEFPASGWSSDPILVTEGSSSFNVLKWTIPHEAGHRNLQLSDIDVDATTIMYYSRGRSDYRLRYCPRQQRYAPRGTENQWETIPR